MSKKKRSKKKKQKRRRHLQPFQGHGPVYEPDPLKILEKKVKDLNLPSGQEIVLVPSRAEKMSEVLLDFMEPYVRFARTDAQHKKLIGLTVLAWNASLLPDTEAAIDQIVRAADVPGLRDLVTGMVERKRRYYADNKRLIISYEVSGSGERLHLSVASTL